MSTSTHAPVPATHPEEQGLPYGTIVGVALGTLVIFAIAILWSTKILNDTLAEQNPHGPAPIPALVDNPEIGIVNQRVFALDNRAEEKRQEQLDRLNSYGWVDASHQVARIPIERAMQLYVEEQGK